MKRLILACLPLLFAMLSCGGPNYDNDWEFDPIYICFEVVNSNGENLFEDTTTDNWISLAITCTFGTDSYSFPFVPQSNEVLCLRIADFHDSTTGKKTTAFCFGPIPGDEDVNSKLTVTWPDGTTNTVSVFNEVKWNASSGPEVTRSIKMNDKNYNGLIKLTK